MKQPRCAPDQSEAANGIATASQLRASISLPAHDENHLGLLKQKRSTLSHFSLSTVHVSPKYQLAGPSKGVEAVGCH